jgi:hypothetical protein
MSLMIPSNNGSKSASYTSSAGNTADFTLGVGDDVVVWCTTDAYVAVGNAVTATASSFPLPAYMPVRLRVPGEPGTSWRVSALQVSAAGTVYAQPVVK